MRRTIEPIIDRGEERTGSDQAATDITVLRLCVWRVINNQQEHGISHLVLAFVSGDDTMRLTGKAKNVT